MCKSLLTILLMILPVTSFADAIDTTIAQHFQRVTGLTARSSDIANLRLAAVKNGVLDEDVLFQKLFAEEGFLSNRLATFASKMSNEEAEPYETVDDFQVAFMLAITGDVPLRDLLAKPFFIEAKGQPNVAINPRTTNYDLSAEVPDYPSLLAKYRLNFPVASGQVVTTKDQFGNSSGSSSDGNYLEGIMTTHGFGARSIKAGTNRRAVRASFNLFLCSKIESWKDASLDDFYVGRDVDRKPGENPDTYQNTCRGCHAPMDSLRGALAHYDYTDLNGTMASTSVVPKYNQNTNVFPDGYVSADAAWENLLVAGAAKDKFGWRGPTTGTGLLAYSTMLGDSEQFQTCMAQRFATVVCELSDSEVRAVLKKPEFKKLAAEFRQDNYNAKTLIKKIATSSLCQK